MSTKQHQATAPHLCRLLSCACRGLACVVAPLWLAAWLLPAGTGSATEFATGDQTMSGPLQLAVTRSRAQDADPSYYIDSDGRGANPRHGLTLAFTPEGVRIDGREGGFALRLERFGRGDGEPVRHTAPHIERAWVEYNRTEGLTEWFANLRRGVEQGWTVTERLEGSGPLVLELNTGRSADLAEDERLVWSELFYDGLVALDANGRRLPARWTHQGTSLRIVVDDEMASYPVVIDPWIHGAKLSPSDGHPGDNFGYHAIISDDGDTVVVGASNVRAREGSSRGGVYVFARGAEGIWTEQASLRVDDAPPRLGIDVALSSDGDTVLASAFGSANSAVYVFDRDVDGSWSQGVELVSASPGGGVNPAPFRTSFCGNGDTAVLGLEMEETAFVYVRSGDIWTEQAELTASDGMSGDLFGGRVTCSGDTLLIAAPRADVDGTPDQGAVYIFTRSQDAWTEQAKLTNSDGVAGDLFGGGRPSLSNNTAVIGTLKGVFNPGEGSAYIFVQNDADWIEQKKLTPFDGDNTVGFGVATDISDSEDTILVGAADPGVCLGCAMPPGAAYVFTRDGGMWDASAKLLPPPADNLESNLFGVSVSMVGSGDAAVIGAAGPIAWKGGEVESRPGAVYELARLSSNFSVVEGTIRSLGYCGAVPAPLTDATVQITGSAGGTYNATTDVNGYYQIPLDETESPVNIEVTAAEHLPAMVANFELEAGEHHVLDLALVLDAPCATVEPPSLSVELEAGATTTDTLSIDNTDGAATLSWEITTGMPPTVDDPKTVTAPPDGNDVRRRRAGRNLLPGNSPEDAVIGLTTVLGESLPSVRPVQGGGGVVNCANEPGLVRHDDGTIEEGYSANPDVASEVIFVDRFTPAVYPASYRAVCVSFGTLGPTSLDFEIVAFDDDGPDGSPGTELGALPVTADGLPGDIGEPTWFSYDISPLGVVVDSGSIFLGVRWMPSDPNVFVLADQSSDDDRPPGFAGGYWRIEASDVWAPIEDAFPEYRSLFLRSVEDLGCDSPTSLPWLSVDPSSGTTPAGGTGDVQVSFDSTGLAPGSYRASICLETNDPVRPRLAARIAMTVTSGGVALEFTPSSLNFGDVPIGSTSSPQVTTLQNIGSSDATDLMFTLANNSFKIDTSACGGNLPADEGCQVSVTFTPEELGETETMLQVSSAEGAPASVGLAGVGVESPPQIDIEPAALSATLDEGQTEIQAVTLANLGDDLLEWEVTEDGFRSPILRPVRRGVVPKTQGPSGTVEGLIRFGSVSNEKTVGYYEFEPAGDQTTITHSVSLEIQGPNTPVCASEDDGTTSENSFLRAFALAEFGITEAFDVTEVTFGVEALSGSMPTVPITVNLYTLEGDFTFDNLTLIGTSTQDLRMPDELSLVIFPVTGTAAADSTLVVEIAAPDLSGQASFFPGSNDLGETAPSYLASAPCNVPEPTPYAEIGFPGVHLVMAVTGETQPLDCTLPDWSGVEPLGGSVPSESHQVVNVTFDATGLQPGEYGANLCLASNDPERPLATVPLAMTVEGVGVTELVFEPMNLEFGDVAVGSTSPPRTTMLHNTGDVDATDVTLTQPGSGFVANTGDCGDTLPAGTSCEVDISFTPAEPGPTTATLQASSAEGASALLDLAGTGIGTRGFTPMALQIDPELLVSNGNGVLEPHELVAVAPTWRNDGSETDSLTGTAADFDGTEGAHYIMPLDQADYGVLDPGESASCLETGVCYFAGVNEPAVRPATHWEASFEETLSDDTSETWDLHIGNSFVDVPTTSPFYPAVETLLHHGVTGGCTDTGYCPSGTNTRGQMAVFLLKAAEGGDYVPRPCQAGEAMFTDVPFDSVFCPWIEQLATRGVTSGCESDKYCPSASVTRAQMAVFLLRALEGDGYTPPTCTGEFIDVNCPSPFANWVEELAAREITGGCADAEYCPNDPVTRAQMASFITRAFELRLYGP